MKQFPLVFKHYLMRTLKDRLSLGIQFALPVGLILMMAFQVADYVTAEHGAEFVQQAMTDVAISYVFSFSLFGGQMFLGYLYNDLKQARKWRLFVAPVDTSMFELAALFGSFTISIFNSLVIMAVATIFTDVQWGNLGVVFLTLLLTTTLSHFFNYFLAILIKTSRVADMISLVTTMVFAILGGGIIIGFHETINLPITDFLFEYGTPLSLARRAVFYAGAMNDDMTVAMWNMLILASVAAVFVILTLILGKVRKR